MRIFEPHIHMVARTTDDYERMALADIRVVVEPAFWLGQPRRRAGSFFDYFDHILGYETDRAALFGIEHYAAISLNPREANDAELRAEVLPELERYLEHPRCVAVGEVGFDLLTDAEEEALRFQLELARQRGLPVLIHTPHHRKKEGTERTIRVLQDLGYDMDMVDLDHNTEETTGLSQRAGAWCGHTLYPITKLSPERACTILQQYGTKKMLVNSSADWGPSDPLMLPRLALEMRRRGFTGEAIAEVLWENPLAFYQRSGRIASLDG